MSYKGERMLPLQLTAAAQLLPYRAVKITSGVPAYPGYGETAHGVTRHIGNANDFVVQVHPLDFIDKEFFLDLDGTVSAQDVVFATGAAGKVKAKTGTVKSRSVTVPGSPVSGDIYITPASTTLVAAWNAEVNTLVAGDLATFTSAWAETAKAAGDIYWVADEGCYVIWSGTAWLTVEPVAIASEAGVSGDTIVCHRYKSMSIIEWEQLEDNIRSVTRTVAAGIATVVSGQTAIRIDDDRIAATDYLSATVVKKGTNAAYIVGNALAADICTITVSADPGSGGCDIFYEIKRILNNV